MSDYFQAFDSLEDMFEFMHANEEAANQTLAPEQRAVTYGDWWCRFYNLGDRVVIFGHAYPLFYWDEKIARATDDEDRSEWEYERAHIVEAHGRGYVYGYAWSTIEVDGEPGSTHQANLWPITPALFEAAREVNWNIDDLPDKFKSELEAVYQAWFNHQQMLRRGPVQ